jgi:hypothetical protein
MLKVDQRQMIHRQIETRDHRNRDQSVVFRTCKEVDAFDTREPFIADQ